MRNNGTMGRAISATAAEVKVNASAQSLTVGFQSKTPLASQISKSKRNLGRMMRSVLNCECGIG
jgi:hypothetical protein